MLTIGFWKEIGERRLLASLVLCPRNSLRHRFSTARLFRHFLGRRQVPNAVLRLTASPRVGAFKCSRPVSVAACSALSDAMSMT